MVSKVTVRFSRKQKRDELNESLEKHRRAVRAEPMTFLTCEFGLRSERVVAGGWCRRSVMAIGIGSN